MKRRFTINLDGDLCNVIDELRGDVSRSKYIERMLFGTVDERGEKAKEVPGYV